MPVYRNTDINKMKTVLLTVLIVATVLLCSTAVPGVREPDMRGTIVLVPVEASQARVDISLVLRGLSEAVFKWSNVDVRIDNRIPLDSPRLMKYPLVYFTTGRGFDLTTAEKNNLSDYLHSGGFVFVEFDVQSYPGFKNYLPPDVRLRPLSDDHPIYSSYFDIESNIWNGHMQKNLGDRSGQYILGPYLTGIWIDDNLVGIYSDKGLGEIWSGFYTAKQSDNSFIRFGVNLVVYALQRIGGSVD